MLILDPELIRETLANNVMEIIFTKKDGTDRIMSGTLDMTRIPPHQHPKSGARKVNEESCSVYDVHNQDWKSFRWDSVTYIHLRE